MVDFENKTIHLDETFNSFCKNTGIAANGQRGQVTRMLENLGGTVFQVTELVQGRAGENRPRRHQCCRCRLYAHMLRPKLRRIQDRLVYRILRAYVGNPQ